MGEPRRESRGRSGTGARVARAGAPDPGPRLSAQQRTGILQVELRDAMDRGWLVVGMTPYAARLERGSALAGRRRMFLWVDEEGAVSRMPSGWRFGRPLALSLLILAALGSLGLAVLAR